MTDLSLARLLLGFAAFQVIWGLHYGLPVSVEPMKALAVLAAGAVAALPLAMLGVVLALVAAELGRAGLEPSHLPTTVAVGVQGLVTNVGIAFLVGAAGCWLLERRRNRNSASDP